MIISRAIILLSLLNIFLLSSCYEYEEACLDQLANNFNIAADSNCKDCCQYPSINLTNTHLLGEGIAFGTDSILINKFGQKYKINKAFFFLSNFEFTFQDGQTKGIIEKAQFQDSDKNKLDLSSDVAFVSVKNSINKLGTMRQIGVIKKVKTTVGISHQLTPTDLNHILFKNDSLYNNNMYTNFVLEVRYGDEFSESKRFELRGTNQVKSITKNIDILKEKRASISINAMIYYNIIANELNFKTADNDTFFNILKKTDWLNFK